MESIPLRKKDIEKFPYIFRFVYKVFSQLYILEENRISSKYIVRQLHEIRQLLPVIMPTEKFMEKKIQSMYTEFLSLEKVFTTVDIYITVLYVGNERYWCFIQIM